MIRLMASLYIKLLRNILSPSLWFIARYTVYLFVWPTKRWKDYKKLDKTQYQLKVAGMPYRGDPLWGAVDYTVYDLDFFFWSGLKRGRDCDDYSFAWFEWAKYKGYPCKQIVVMEHNKIATSHIVTVFKDNQGWNCTNNQLYKSGFPSYLASLNWLKEFSYRNPNGTTFKYNNMDIWIMNSYK